jgi:hypothetical protein
MSDEVLTIKLTEREIDLLHQCISTNMETVKRRHDPADPMISDLLQELGELSDDLLEQRFRPDDAEFVVCDAETRMFNVGTDAREKMKEKSRAADRRNFNLKVKDKRLSKAQTHDVWDANDPKNW